MMLVEFCVIWFHDRSRVHIYIDHPAQSANCPHPFPACILLLSLLPIVCKTHGEVRRGKSRRGRLWELLHPPLIQHQRTPRWQQNVQEKGGGGGVV
ncbi:hypothetical protein BDP67DRAFT_84269 [Colletotrichum lupini]|nr:hypothetical protein BDP67DRAFT_84269 [Colletotrichum lupini]